MHFHITLSSCFLSASRITSQIQELEKETAAFNITVVKERQTYNDRIEALTREKSELSQELQEAVDSLGILQKRVSTLESTLSELKENHANELELLRSESVKSQQ
ncbi:hypothetical protein OESDEN_15157, partial [Oesophagostomum dentatum]